MDAALRRVDDLLARVYQLPEEERPAFLDRECDGTPDLRREIEDLLSIDSELLAEPEKPVFELISSDPEASPSRLGPFRCARHGH